MIQMLDLITSLIAHLESFINYHTVNNNGMCLYHVGRLIKKFRFVIV